jgi:tetratricopeptide (TPR) repeat protein
MALMVTSPVKIVLTRAILSIALAGVLIACDALAGDATFTNSLQKADIAAKRGEVGGAEAIYDAARQKETNSAPNLCVLSRRYCDLSSVARAADVQKGLVARALDCAGRAVALEPDSATAHASVAVCYAKSCAFADIKAQLAYSKLFKQEAEKAIALDPKQDVAYYLLGRWNYAIANVGFFSRAYVRMVYGGLPKASLAESVRYFKKACELAPNRIVYHSGLAMAYGGLGEKDLQLAELQTCRALKPSDPEDAEARAEAERQLESQN